MIKRSIVPLLALTLSACASDVVRNAAPPIGDTIGSQDSPDAAVLPILASDPVAADPQKALDNYRKLLELQTDVDTKSASMRRLADLQVQVEDTQGAEGEDAIKSSKSAIKLYNQLLYSHPDDPNNDRIFYQLARAYQNAGDNEAAIETLEKLVERHPQSALVGDARFRRAELLFANHQYAEAEAEYAGVIAQPSQSTFFESAQYKMGWARFKQGNFEGALDLFIAILNRELPRGDFIESKEALKTIGKAKNDIARDSLRVVSLSFGAMGGGKAINAYIDKKGEPRFAPLLYASVAEQQLEKRRYREAAETDAAFIQRYPNSPHAPTFQTRVISAYAAGGFNDEVAKEKERFVTTYDPQASYWAGRKPTAEVLGLLRGNLDDLAKHAQAAAQKKKDDTGAYADAAKWNRRILEAYPKDKQNAETQFLLAQNLFDSGQILESAQEYAKAAYDYPPNAKSADAAYASVFAYQKLADRTSKEQRPQALRLSAEASARYIEKFPTHREVTPVLTHTAENLYELKNYPAAIGFAARVLKPERNAPEAMRRSAARILADSQFALQHYAEAEAAYAELIKLTSSNSERGALNEQMAAAIYKQGEAARTQGDLNSAAKLFQRVAELTPEVSIRATAQYDAAAAYIQLKDWPNAERQLEGFRTTYPGHALIPDVDKKLAVAYQADNKPELAAAAFQRIAGRSAETSDSRRDAAWLSATLLDRPNATNEAIRAYENYLKNYPAPLDRAMDARERLAQLSQSKGDASARARWLREIINADADAGSERNDHSRALAARASLELGRTAAADTQALRLNLPLEKSLPKKKAAMEKAITLLESAVGYGFGDVSTAATYELGRLYRDFGKALLDSDRPKLSDLELEQYNALLEEQAYPFEEKAIAAYEANLKATRNGAYDEWIGKSYDELLKLAPAKYGKNEKGDDRYETLR